MKLAIVLLMVVTGCVRQQSVHPTSPVGSSIVCDKDKKPRVFFDFVTADSLERIVVLCLDK